MKFWTVSEKRWPLQVLYFRNYGLRKSCQINVQKSRLRGPFDKQHGKLAKPLFKSAWHYLYHIHWSLPSQLSQKKYLFLTCQILRLLVNTLVADEKCPVLNRDNLTIPIQMQLSLNQKTFAEYFPAFLKSVLNFNYFEKKITLKDFAFPKLLTPKKWSDKCLETLVSEEP